jgi:hypothetical protein
MSWLSKNLKGYKRKKYARRKEPVEISFPPITNKSPFTSGWRWVGKDEDVIESLVYAGYDERELRLFEDFMIFDNRWGGEEKKEVYGKRVLDKTRWGMGIFDVYYKFEW